MSLPHTIHLPLPSSSLSTSSQPSTPFRHLSIQPYKQVPAMSSTRFLTLAQPMRSNLRAVLRPTTITASQRYASSASPNGLPQLPPGFEKLAHSPSALSAITNLVEIMKQNGVNLQSGEKPSMWQMIKLAKNQEVRDATSKGTSPPPLL